MRMTLKNRLPGILIMVVLLLAEILFMSMLISTKLVPTKFLILGAVGLLLVAVGIFFIVRDSRRLVPVIIGAVLTGVIVVGLASCGSYIHQGVNAISNITTVSVEIADVGVYVRADDPAEDIQDSADYTFGILAEQDRSNTDETVKELNELMNTTISTVEYPGLGELVDALLNTEEIDAMIINSGFVFLFEDMEGYEDTESSIRELHVAQIETEIVQVVEEEKKPTSIFDLFKKDKDDDKKPSSDASGSVAESAAQEANDSVFSVYISGIDSRSSNMIAKSRSDVNIIATVNTETKQVLLVSTPRDFYVPLPISNGQPDKLTHAGIYGVDCSIGTLEMLYETDIDYYFRVNFTGFENIIDALDGVDVYSDYTFSSQGYQFYEGENHLYGEKALVFARTRKAFAAGDRQRGKNQMAVIEAVIDKAMSPALLSNYSSILESVSGSFETTIPYDLIAEVVRDQLDKGGEWNIVSMSADGTGASKRPYSMSVNAYVMVPNYDTVNAAIAKMEQVKNGEIISE